MALPLSYSQLFWGDTVDFRLCRKPDKKTADSFFKKLTQHNEFPSCATIDKSRTNRSALKALEQKIGRSIEIIQKRYANNRVEQDHRFIKKRRRPMLGFKSFKSTTVLLADIESIHMLHKGHVEIDNNDQAVPTYYALIGRSNEEE